MLENIERRALNELFNSTYISRSGQVDEVSRRVMHVDMVIRVLPAGRDARSFFH